MVFKKQQKSESTKPAFLVLYRGSSVAEARVVAASSDPKLVQEFLKRITGDLMPVMEDTSHQEGKDEEKVSS